ncbi:DMT family transporter [Roseococcus suduntuyensis]|uniref:Drug/metabolite transporter (DMT)-like permease n=1 Tax=Roseococcus suduntuyensis TaxID=455361 RepID=A0A840AAT9_9PROT|nr:DMT family transporter [Roseococcus suduntuyensis]MBB3898012.1 drug/metabolite transporter (DMT)-like permease [Roseococcus suduntuyensis]
MALRHDARRGALLMLGATALFTLMGALVKLVGDRIHFLEIMFFRSVLALPVVLLIVARMGHGVRLRTQRLPQHVGRALTGTMAMSCAFFSLTVLPLAEQTALTFTTPLFVTLLAIPFLGERVGIHRFSAVLLGFGGILVIALGQGAFQGRIDPWIALGMSIAVMHGVFSAMTTLLVRSLSATESSTTIVIWQSILMTCFTGLALPFVWVTPTPWEFLLLMGVGLVGGIAQVMLTEAYASAQVSSLGAYSYTGILWAVLLGWIFFGDTPGIATFLGAGLIVLAALYIMQREMRRGVKR